MSRLMMYIRASGCPDQSLARRCLEEFGVKPIEVNISHEPDAAQMLLELAGCLAVPTFVAANDEGEPISPPLSIAPGRSVRNIDRGSVISEPTREGLRLFLVRHGFLPS
jgi:glutaredoxin